MKLAVCLSTLWLVVGCGYRPVYGGTPPDVRLSVTSDTHLVAEPSAVDGVLDGVRRTLSRAGALASGEGYPRVVVEVLRVDEVARGLQAASGQASDGVIARGASVAVTARGWVVERSDAAPTRDTGDVRRVVTYAHQGDVRLDALARRGAVRDSAEQVGEALARRVLGFAEPAAEPL